MKNDTNSKISLTQIIKDLDEILPNTNPNIFINETQETEINEKFILEQLYH